MSDSELPEERDDQTFSMFGEDEAPKSAEYQVLARKYRPRRFEDLIGQEAMVRTLSNAFETGRVAHAFMLTGVRGVGKTTTARLLARALNYQSDDHDGPSIRLDPKGEHCDAIMASRHPDVLELDAASRTGVADMRDLLDGARYAPVSARHKVYIIDEVHMLSTAAFNALLKTLEEPPPHVKFIFATTEIRKVPVTVLSRCQRFDLRRIEVQRLADHFKGICEKEGAEISEAALHLIARAADGSVRDGLSILDQAIAMTEGAIGEDLVRDMLGLADRSQGFDLLEKTLQGDTPGALNQLASMYQDGADPAAVLNDLLEIVHFLTRAKLVPETLTDPAVPEIERVRGKDLSERLGMGALARAWQMLLKGVGEVQHAPNAIQATEMIIVRLAHAANMPTPEEAIRRLTDEGAAAPAPAASAPQASAPQAPAPQASAPQAPAPSPPSAPPAGGGSSGGGTARALAQPEPDYDDVPDYDAEPDYDPAPTAEADTAPLQARIETFADLVALAGQLKEGILQSHMMAQVHLVTFEPGRMEFRPGPGAPDNLAGDLGKFLKSVTGERWMVTVSNEAGQPTLAEQQAKAQAAEKDELSQHPLVKAVMETFPGAAISKVRHPDDET
ncbi:DNA polymerase III subunit gamma/tau [Hyphomonas sp. UBA3201]|uniref:DNA polymerase III subunit gamma/tau n=2 Tax=unclassified Hyphomonas TaxID=2630699 RepID=UPI0025B868D4|nr:DNA polymerase III subunit gamma/tau [Hyphomonas sp. UBA3201]